MIEACRAFVHVFRATHYVTAIELGAAEYTVEVPADSEEPDTAEQNSSGSLKRRKQPDVPIVGPLKATRADIKNRGSPFSPATRLAHYSQ